MVAYCCNQSLWVRVMIPINIYILVDILIFVHMNTLRNIPGGMYFVPYLISMFIFGTSINFYVLMFTDNRSFRTYEFSLSP